MVIFERSPFSEIIWVKNWALTNTIEVHHDIKKNQTMCFRQNDVDLSPSVSFWYQ